MNKSAVEARFQLLSKLHVCGSQNAWHICQGSEATRIQDATGDKDSIFNCCSGSIHLPRGKYLSRLNTVGLVGVANHIQRNLRCL